MRYVFESHFEVLTLEKLDSQKNSILSIKIIGAEEESFVSVAWKDV